MSGSGIGLVILATACLTMIDSTIAGTDPSAIHWGNDFEAAVTTAMQRNKPVLLEFYSDGCPWCKQMDKTIHPYPPAIELINREFVAVRLTGRKDLREKYHTPGNPATIVIDPKTQRVIRRTYGYREPGGYILMLKLGLEDHQMMARHPEMTDAYLDIAEMTRNKQWGRAAEQLSDLTRKYPSEGMLWTTLCECAFESLQYDQAIEAGKRAIALRGAFASSARYKLAAAHMCRNDYAHAAPLLKRNLDDPIMSGGWYEMSLLWVCESLMGRRDAVTQLALRHIDTVPSTEDLWWERLIVIYQAGKESDERMARLAAQRGGSHVTQWHYIAAVQKLVAGDKAGAIQELDKAIAGNDVTFDIHRMAAALRDSLSPP